MSPSRTWRVGWRQVTVSKTNVYKKSDYETCALVGHTSKTRVYLYENSYCPRKYRKKKTFVKNDNVCAGSTNKRAILSVPKMIQITSLPALLVQVTFGNRFGNNALPMVTMVTHWGKEPLNIVGRKSVNVPMEQIKNLTMLFAQILQIKNLMRQAALRWRSLSGSGTDKGSFSWRIAFLLFVQFFTVENINDDNREYHNSEDYRYHIFHKNSYSSWLQPMEEYNTKTTNPTTIMPIKISSSITIILSALGQADLSKEILIDLKSRDVTRNLVFNTTKKSLR